MKSISRRPTKLYGIIITLVSLFFIGAGGVAAVVQVSAESPQPAPGERLITLHDGGQDKGILTRAATLRDALDGAKISVDPNDIVEPGLDEKLIATTYDVNIYRARPVTVVDGSVRQKVMSPYQTAKQIAEHAGIELHDEDNSNLEANTDMVSEGAGVQLNIKRATEFTFVLYGKSITAYTQAKTIGDMLKEKKITLAANDSLSASVDIPMTKGMTVQLWRNGKQTLTEEQSVAFETEKVKDMDREVGYREVKTPGQAGKRTVTYEIDMQNGQEVSRKEIQSLVTKEPVKQVEIVGGKYALPPGSHEDWMAAAGISASDYGFVNYIILHEGGWCPVRWQGDRGCVDHGSAPSGLGYGLVQATPGNKMATAGEDWLTNPITQLRWATGYAVGKYGSWEDAYNHWLSVHSW